MLKIDSVSVRDTVKNVHILNVVWPSPASHIDYQGVLYNKQELAWLDFCTREYVYVMFIWILPQKKFTCPNFWTQLCFKRQSMQLCKVKSTKICNLNNFKQNLQNRIFTNFWWSFGFFFSFSFFLATFYWLSAEQFE